MAVLGVIPAPALAPGILQLVLSLETGGTERLVVDLCVRLRRRFRMAVCCLDGTGALASELAEHGIEVVPLGREPGFRFSLGPRIAKVAARFDASVVHCHQYSPFVYGRIASLFAPHLRLVFTEHGRHSDAPPSLKRRLINPLLTLGSGRVYSVSAALRESMIAEGFPPLGINVIHNGIEPGPRPTAADRRAARYHLGVWGDAVVVGTVARLDPVKNLELLIEGFAGLRSWVPRSVLVIVGDGPERAKLETCARQAGVADAVRFLGNRTDVRRVLPAFDIYANTSISEGVSLTILEAMAAAVPVIATRVGGTPEVVENGITGLLVPARDQRRLTAALIELSCSPDLRRAIGDAGRERIEQRFTIDRMVEQYAAVYSGLAG
jgi:glycosyltransferase involved in cell wall biosynthesis